MPTQSDMPQVTKRLRAIATPMPHVDQSIAEVDHILTHWLDKGLDMDHALWATGITTNNIQGEDVP